jgi:hypothetical protein
MFWHSSVDSKSPNITAPRQAFDDKILKTQLGVRSPETSISSMKRVASSTVRRTPQTSGSVEKRMLVVALFERKVL